MRYLLDAFRVAVVVALWVASYATPQGAASTSAENSRELVRMAEDVCRATDWSPANRLRLWTRLDGIVLDGLSAGQETARINERLKQTMKSGTSGRIAEHYTLEAVQGPGRLVYFAVYDLGHYCPSVLRVFDKEDSRYNLVFSSEGIQATSTVLQLLLFPPGTDRVCFVTFSGRISSWGAGSFARWEYLFEQRKCRAVEVVEDQDYLDFTYSASERRLAVKYCAVPKREDWRCGQHLVRTYTVAPEGVSLLKSEVIEGSP